jgi:hypothetical protein
MHRHFTFPITLSLVLATASTAAAEDPSRRSPGRLELSFDAGYGFGTEGDYGEVAMDFRAFAPNGVGGVFRAGVATQIFSNALAVDLGFALRANLVGGEIGGLAISGALGPSFAYGPFDVDWVDAWGGWAMLGLDLWHRHFVVGVGVTAHLLVPTSHDRQASWAGEVPGRSNPITTIAPTIRVGWAWGR